MRLLRYTSDGQIGLTQDLSDDERPRYAIFSHTWAIDIRDEVTFAEVTTEEGRKKVGYQKIWFCAEQAKKDGIHHFWVDTCCINKADHTEFSEAITSMYKWYQKAQKCYVYLDDVTLEPCNSKKARLSDWESSLRASRWFTRGWTLQELLAPPHVVFFSKEWLCLGTKFELISVLHEITNIPIAALRGQALSEFSVSERLQWADGQEEGGQSILLAWHLQCPYATYFR